MKKNWGFIVIIALLILVVIGLAVYIFYHPSQDNLDHNCIDSDLEVKPDDTSSSKKDPITVVNDDQCADGCTEQIIIDNGDKFSVYASSQKLKIGDKTILELEGASSIKQVTVYDDIIIALEQISLGCEVAIYDIKGNLIKTFSLFNDEQGRIFNIYPRYNQEEFIHVDENGKISFYGTKHTQGAANTYISDSGDTIDLCTQGESMNENSIVSGIFEFSYLGDNEFSEIKFVSIRKSVKDIKSC